MSNFDWDEYRKSMSKYRETMRKHYLQMADHHKKMSQSSKWLGVAGKVVGVAEAGMGVTCIVMSFLGLLSMSYLILSSMLIGAGVGWWTMGRLCASRAQSHLDSAKDYLNLYEA